MLSFLPMILFIPSKPNTEISISYILTYILFPIQNLWSSPRPISKCQLNTLLCLHLIPIYLILSKGSYSLKLGRSHLEGGFTLRCLQRLSLPDLATLPWL